MGQEEVLEYLSANPSATTLQIADALGVSRNAVSVSLNKLIRDGHVVQMEEEYPPLYRLADKPKKKGGRKPAITLSREELEAAFRDAGSAKVLGERLGCNTQTVINYLDRYGIERPRYGKARAEKPQEPPQEAQEEERVEVPDGPEIEPTPRLLECVNKLEQDIAEEQERIRGENIRYVITDDVPTVSPEEEPEPIEEYAKLRMEELGKEIQEKTNPIAIAEAVTRLAECIGELVGVMVGQERTITVEAPEAPSEELLKGLTSGEPVKAVEMPDMATVECREMPESVQGMTIPSYDDLAHLHYGLMLSIHEIGRQYRVLGPTVRKWMLYRGLPMWTEAETKELQELLARVNKKTVSQATLDKAHADYIAFWDRERERYGYAPQETARQGSEKAVA